MVDTSELECNETIFEAKLPVDLDSSSLMYIGGISYR